MKRRTLWGLLWLLLLALPARAEEASLPVIAWSAPTQAGVVSVRSDELDGENWLFLPSCADLSALPLTADGVGGELRWQGENGESAPYQAGEAVDWLSLATTPLDGVYTCDLTQDGKVVFRLHVMKSAYLRSMHIASDDPVREGREWLEDCLAHERFTSASLLLLRADGTVSAHESIEKLRGRGNSTWEKAESKKPYQLKLEHKLDLLETGDPAERNKKWVLLSNEAILTLDPELSMLRNQIALDLGLEFGLSDTPRCEQINLYYDDRYRGTYLLCEKVEVKEGRLGIPDYDEWIEEEAEKEGLDLDSLPMGTAVNRFGQTLHFTLGVPALENPQAGGYLVELERGTYDDGTVSDPAWFTLSNGQNFALKNPGMGGVEAVTYVSELMEDAYAAFANFGVHPQTGEPVSKWMDVDSFTRSFLMQEITQNKDAYASTSTNFVIYPNERRLYAGPIWDFDLSTEKTAALRDNSDWARYFYRTTPFQSAAKRIYAEELYPLIRDILLGDKEGAHLKSLAQYEKELHASWDMNYHRFIAKGLKDGANVVHLSSCVSQLRTFYDKQSEWLLEEIASWSEDEPSKEADILLDSPMGDIARFMTARVEEPQRSSLYVCDFSLTCLTEATQESDGLWQAVITLASKPGCSVQDGLTLRLNGQEVSYERLADNRVRTSLAFANPLYRPAVYQGVDYGLVFHLAYFRENYPDLWEECGQTLEGALRYYVETGMDEGLPCSEAFDPTSIPLNDWDLEAKYQDDWRKYIELFLAEGETDALERFAPQNAGE